MDFYFRRVDLDRNRGRHGVTRPAQQRVILAGQASIVDYQRVNVPTIGSTGDPPPWAQRHNRLSASIWADLPSN